MLHAVYTVCDCFVSASVTETFGQTINEALASDVLVAIPRSAGFEDAYSHVLPPDQCMWTPGDVDDMVRIIRLRLKNGRTVDRALLQNWDAATQQLVEEYKHSYRNHSVIGK